MRTDTKNTGNFLPDDLPNSDLPSVFPKANGFRVGDDLLPELRGRINYARPAEQRWKAYRGGRFAPCKPGDPEGRLYLRIEIEVDGYGPRTIDVPPASHASLKEFYAQHPDERVRLTIAAKGKYFSLLFEPDDGQPMAAPVDNM